MEEKELKRVVIARNSPQVSHLFFADDSILFCKTNKGDFKKVVEILKEYESASGQLINRENQVLFLVIMLGKKKGVRQ